MCVCIYIYTNPGLVANTCNLRIWEAEAEWFPKVCGQPGLQLRPCLKKQGNSPPKATDTKDFKTKGYLACGNTEVTKMVYNLYQFF